MNLRITAQDFLNNLKDFAKKLSDAGQPSESEEKKTLKKELDEIEQAYNNSPYMTINGKKIAILKPMEDNPLSDEEIAATAENFYAEDKKNKSDKLNDSYADKVRLKEESKAALDKSVEKSAAEIAAKTAEAKSATENDALKRGIARSSIVMEELNGLDKQSIDALGKLYETAAESEAKINSEIDSLKTELSDALNALDGETAVKINEKIKALTAERDKKSAEVLKYNNSLKSETAKQLNEIGKDIDETNSTEYIESNAAKIKKLYSYYYSLGENGAKELTSDEDFVKKYVGSKGYDYLKKIINR